MSDPLSPRFHGQAAASAYRYVGTPAQLYRIDSLIEAEGPARGARRLRMVSGGGLELEVHPDRCLDLGQMTVHGVPLAWMSPTGIAHPALRTAHPESFLQTFGGGLLSTCGLDHFGPASTDGGRAFGQHGRVGVIPAQVVRQDCTGNALVVEGVVRQAAVHHECFELRRRITVPLGQTCVHIDDTVTNLGWRSEPHMIMYHCNFGWPLLAENAVLEIPSSHVEPVTPGLDAHGWDALAAPEAGRGERVWFHHFDSHPMAAVTLRQPAPGLAMTLRFDTATLPALCQWQMFGERQYVMGLEPANVAWGTGRGTARSAGRAPHLEPGESVHYHLQIEVAPGR